MPCRPGAPGPAPVHGTPLGDGQAAIRQFEQAAVDLASHDRLRGAELDFESRNLGHGNLGGVAVTALESHPLPDGLAGRGGTAATETELIALRVRRLRELASSVQHKLAIRPDLDVGILDLNPVGVEFAGGVKRCGQPRGGEHDLVRKERYALLVFAVRDQQRHAPRLGTCDRLQPNLDRRALSRRDVPVDLEEPTTALGGRWVGDPQALGHTRRRGQGRLPAVRHNRARKTVTVHVAPGRISRPRSKCPE